MNPDPVAGSPANSTDANIGIVVADWHSEITHALLEAAISTLQQCGVAREDIYVSHVPGAMELPFAVRQMAIVKEPSAVIALGCVTQEGNPLYNSICQSVTDSLTQLNLHSDIPYIFGVLTTATLEEAKALATGAANSGAKSAETALKMVNMMAALINS